jgi:hypothetical protein
MAYPEAVVVAYSRPHGTSGKALQDQDHPVHGHDRDRRHEPVNRSCSNETRSIPRSFQPFTRRPAAQKARIDGADPRLGGNQSRVGTDGRAWLRRRVGLHASGEGGSVSSFAETGEEFGGVLGFAVFGSLGAAMILSLRGGRCPSSGDLSPGGPHGPREPRRSGLLDRPSMRPPLAPEVLGAARDAFTTAI